MNEIKKFFKQDEVEEKFRLLLGERAPQFLTSVMQAVSENYDLQYVDPKSIYGAAVTAALINLPINKNLGFAHIVPYKGVAQFQMGWKGFVQLAHRTNQFVRINPTDVMEGEIIERDRLTGDMKFKWLPDSERKGLEPIGYVSYFRLVNGFESTFYMTSEELDAHAKKYSEAYRNNNGPWVNDKPAMCRKTVIKLNLSKNAPLSLDMQRAIMFDQGVTFDGETVEYVDNPEIEIIDEKQKAIAEKLNGILD
jgi:recombination protein RecT